MVLLARGVIGVMLLGFMALIVIAVLPLITERNTEVRTDSAQDAGLMCTTGAGETSCDITLSDESAFADMSGITVTETSPGSGDRTDDSTLGDDRLTISVSGLSPSTSYAFTVDYLVVNSQVADATGLDGFLAALPLIFAAGTILLTVGAAIWVLRSSMGA